MEPVRVLELYSGIGGMHQALTESCISAEVVAAVDVNTVANEVYKHNFPSTPLWAKTIEGITLAELNRLSFDMILMSPPCQPFTRIGLQGDVSDPRTNSFLYILDILPRKTVILHWQIPHRKKEWNKRIIKAPQRFLICGGQSYNMHPDTLQSHKLKIVPLYCSSVTIWEPILSVFCAHPKFLLSDLPWELQRLPKYILLENVKGFETSSARDKLIETLKKCGFKYQEFLLSPTCLGIPNSRLRYFLIAKRQSELFSFQAPGQILENFPDQEPKASVEHRVTAGLEKESCFMPPKEEYIDPNSGSDGGSGRCSEKEAFVFKLETAKEMEKKQNQDSDLSLQMLKDFLEEDGEEMSQHFLPPKALLRYAFLLDIVTPSCRRSTCFTKGYGHYVEGTGSVLQTAEDVKLQSVFKSIEMLSEEEKLMKLSTLKLRYFTPREIANLHGFPPEFGFPDKITMKQRYRLLGNSLNVHVVAKLISLLTG